MNPNALPKLEPHPLFLRDKFRLGLFFGLNDELKAAAKTLSATYSKTYRCWYEEDEKAALEKIKQALKGKAWVDSKNIQARLHESIQPSEIHTNVSTRDLQKATRPLDRITSSNEDLTRLSGNEIKECKSNTCFLQLLACMQKT